MSSLLHPVMSLMFKQRASSTTVPGTPIYTYKVCVAVEQKKQQNLGNAILLENSWTPLLQNPMVRAAHKLPAWKPNGNSHMCPSTLPLFPDRVDPPDCYAICRRTDLCFHRALLRNVRLTSQSGYSRNWLGARLNFRFLVLRNLGQPRIS